MLCIYVSKAYVDIYSTRTTPPSHRGTGDPSTCSSQRCLDSVTTPIVLRVSADSGGVQM